MPIFNENISDIDKECLLSEKLKCIEMLESEAKDQENSLDKKRERIFTYYSIITAFFTLSIGKETILFEVYILGSIVIFITLGYLLSEYDKVTDSPILNKDHIFPENSSDEKMKKYKNKMLSPLYFKEFLLTSRYNKVECLIKIRNKKSIYVNKSQSVIYVFIIISLMIFLIKGAINMTNTNNNTESQPQTTAPSNKGEAEKSVNEVIDDFPDVNFVYLKKSLDDKISFIKEANENN